MRPLGVVVMPPLLDDPAGIKDRREPVFVEATVVEPVVEAFEFIKLPDDSIGASFQFCKTGKIAALYR